MSVWSMSFRNKPIIGICAQLRLPRQEIRIASQRIQQSRPHSLTPFESLVREPQGKFISCFAHNSSFYYRIGASSK